jgi:hypothetical protein
MLRLGFLTHLHVGADASDSYRIALERTAREVAPALGWRPRASAGRAQSPVTAHAPGL